MALSTPGRLSLAGRTVVAVADAAQYAEYASGVEGAASPLPVLADAWERFTASCGSLPTAGEDAPGPAGPSWQGTVFVCDPQYAAVGRVLAGATGRPLLDGSFAEAVELARSTPVTVVAGPSVIGPEELAAVPVDAQLGFFTARSAGAASALAVRTLLNGPAAAALGDVFVDALSPEESAPGRLFGPDASPRRLRSVIGEGVAVLAGRGHARDCVMHLNGGGICGRSEEQPLLAVLPGIGTEWSEHLTACQQGEGCWRADVPMEKHLRASQVRAAFVVLDSCRTAVAGRGSVRTDVSVPLNMLEGSALAVAVAAGTRGGAEYAAPLFQALVRSGLTLGAALRETNSAIDADREGVGKLVLFGDAGLVPAPVSPGRPAGAPGDTSDTWDTWDTVGTGDTGQPLPLVDGAVDVAEGPGALLVAAPDLLADDEDGPLAVTRADGASSWVLTSAAGRGAGRLHPAPPQLDTAWTQRALPWLDRLRALDGMGLKPNRAQLDNLRHQAVTAVRDRAEATGLRAAQEAVDAFAEALDGLSRLQERLLADETRWVSTSFYSATDGWPRPWRARTGPGLGDCPQCGAEALVRHDIRTGAGVGLPLHSLVCVRCGEVEAGAAEFAAQVAVQSPPEVRRGEPFTVRVTVTAPADRPVAVALGAAVVNEQLLHCTLARTTAVELAPGESRTVEFAGSSDGARAKTDLQPVKILVAADGAVRCLTRNVWLRV
ncbi:hypothetical protein ACFVVX_03380 [Kitasatospora sp. NPDC058170]|uniref:hypothetical protein n=1 Tax=Kitasatospora sp. NPDC058170 TaxID=3346364 RepID=UPI0036D95F12